MRGKPFLHLAAWTGLLFAFVVLPSSLAARDLSVQIEEVIRLVKEKNFVTALEDLKFIAQQIQDLRLSEVQPLFPEPPPGWEAAPAVRTSREGESWSRHLEVRKTYIPESGMGKVEIIFNNNSACVKTKICLCSLNISSGLIKHIQYYSHCN